MPSEMPIRGAGPSVDELLADCRDIVKSGHDYLEQARQIILTSRGLTTRTQVAARHAQKVVAHAVNARLEARLVASRTGVQRWRYRG
jgi:hypothetical protein